VRSRTTEKIRNCIQPFAVMSELLREEQREDQVRQQDDGEDKGDGSEQVHVYLNFWQAFTYRKATPKKTAVKNSIVRSCIANLAVCAGTSPRNSR
jgi:hypothetical protein